MTQKIEFHLNQVSVKLSNDEGRYHYSSCVYFEAFFYYNLNSIAGVVAHKVGVDVSVRSSAGGLGISAKLGSISMTGHSIGQAPPEIITTKRDPSGTVLCETCLIRPPLNKTTSLYRPLQ